MISDAPVISDAPAISDADAAPDAAEVLDAPVDAVVIDALQSTIAVDRTAAIAGIEQVTITVTVFRGRGDGTFYPEISSAIPPDGPVNAIASADFNGDGKLDLVLSQSYLSALTVLLGAGNGQFTTQSTPLPSHAAHVAVADFNLDAKPDVVMALPNTQQVLVALGNGNGTFTQGSTIGNMDAWDLEVMDANGDGKPDVVVSASSYLLVTLLGVGNGTFQAPLTVSAPNGAFIAGDFKRIAHSCCRQ